MRGSTTVVIPPAGTPATDAPPDAEPDIRFFPGNLHDRENMALALAVQGGLAHASRIPGRGVHRDRLPELLGASLPAVLVQIGFLTNKEDAAGLADFACRKEIAGGIAGGILRYAAYLQKGAPPETPEGQRLALEDVTLTERPVDGGEIERSVRVAIARRGEAEIDPARVEVGVYFIDRVGDGHLEPTVADPPDSAWISASPDWDTRRLEELEVVCRFPDLSTEEKKVVGERSFYGIAVRVLYDGQVQDEAGSPERLGRCLYQFFTLSEP